MARHPNSRRISPHIGRVARSRRVDCSSLPSQPFITPPGCKSVPSLAQRAPSSVNPSLRSGQTFGSPPDSFHSLPLRRGSEASSHGRASSGLPTLSPLLLLYFQLSHTSNAGPTSFIHFVHFFLNKATIVLHLRSFPLRLSPYAAHLSPVPLAPLFSSRCAAAATNGGSVLSCCVGQLN